MSESTNNSFNIDALTGLNRSIQDEGELGHRLDHLGDNAEWNFGTRFRRGIDDIGDSSVEDENIHKKVFTALFKDRLIHEKDVTIEVQNGVVTLTGKVPDRKTKVFAQDCLENIYGVIEVKNHLSVKAGNGLVGTMNWPL